MYGPGENLARRDDQAGPDRGSQAVFSSAIEAADPAADPTQYEPLTTRSTRPRAGRDQLVDGR